MAAITNWVSYYRANRSDGGTIEALYALDDEELAEIASGHNNNVSAFRTTITNSGGGNVLLVPGSKGFVHFLHHQGFATTPHLGGETILGFIQGNFSASPFKVIRRPSEAVTLIDQGRSETRVKSAPTACPTLGAILGAQGKDAFATLPGEIDTLADRPNHLFIHLRMFTKADGPKTMRSKELAWALVNQLNAALTRQEPTKNKPKRAKNKRSSKFS
jgi:hypothetical protein